MVMIIKQFMITQVDIMKMKMITIISISLEFQKLDITN
ncbi:hypothetical protein cce_4962 [Crocosphaera subtropica ATCC 51142]|uniref:Uncharacterized protein n=1 Tax=Crocosphaera subtropica (strain ATCC 51142 / BH68) TaxID=43989 RepID=B1X2E7_CROS5|nr:hypothetical protein cce_4962 [Crocosphaera subtropica ATCC 51142]